MSESLIPVAVNALASPDEFLLEAFPVWETRGRGWGAFDYPVEIEPTLVPLYFLLAAPDHPVFDDGKTEGFWSGLFGGSNGVSEKSAALASYRTELAEHQSLILEAMKPEFSGSYGAEFIELRIALPKELKITAAVFANLLTSFSYLSHPVSFEIIGTRSEIVIQLCCTEADLLQVKGQLAAYLPDCFIRQGSDYLTNEWSNGESDALIADFGLSNEFFLPLKTISSFEPDFLFTLIGALSDLRDGEIGVFQVLFQKAKQDWAKEILDSVYYLEETDEYSGSAGKLRLAKEKITSPLYAASIRCAGKSSYKRRTLEIVKSLGAGLASLSKPSGNELIPLSNDGIFDEYHEQSLITRQTLRGGMLLNLDELVSLVHLPSPSVRSKKLFRETGRTKAAPSIALYNQLVLGYNVHQSETREVSLSAEQRTKHLHLIGSSGSGKSTLLLNLIKQDLENGEGLCVIDPHGDLIDDCLANVPDERIKDVILFDPADSDFPIGFNILKANSELEKNLLASDLIATFRRMATSWGDVMDSVLANAILAFVESTKGGTLFDLKRFLVEKDFRSEFLKTVDDGAIRYFWQNEFPLISGKPQSSILIRLDSFLRQKLVRNIVCQKENRIDFRKAMDEKKVLLIKLSQGLIGEENAHLLGTLLVSKLYQTALSRQNTRERPFFWLYMDEFHHFITPSMESVLSGVRKYNIGLHLAHQEFRQLQSRDAEVASSVLSNCYTRICFRLGDTDAEKFASGFSFFDSKALQNLSVGECIARVERAEFDFNLKTEKLAKVSKEIAEQRKRAIIQCTRTHFAKPRAEVEAETIFTQTTNQETVSKSGDDAVDLPLTSKPKTHSKAASSEKMKEVFTEKPTLTPIAANEFFAVSLPDLNEIKFSEINQQHKYLQSLVKRMAESKGFLSTVEKELFGGLGRIDVALEKESLKIACEISVTNEPDYEVQNIRKCLSANFSPVVMLSSDARHLEKIRQLAVKDLSDAELSQVNFFSPEEFHLWLEDLGGETIGSEETVKGFKVKVKLKPGDKQEHSTRKKAISDVVFGALKSIKNKLSDK